MRSKKVIKYENSNCLLATTPGRGNGSQTTEPASGTVVVRASTIITDVNVNGIQRLHAVLYGSMQPPDAGLFGARPACTESSPELLGFRRAAPASSNKPSHGVPTIALMEFEGVGINQPASHEAVGARHQPSKVPTLAFVAHGNGRPDAHDRL